METYNRMIWVLNILEIVAALTGFIFFKKLKGSYWKWLPFYLLFIVCVEFAGRYFASDPALYRYNILMYKFVGFPVQFLFFYFLFYQHDYFRDKRNRIIAGAAVYILSIIAEVIFLSGKTYWFHSFSYSVGNVILLVFLLQYFFIFIRSKEILQFTESLMFWVCLGLFVYYLGSFPYWGLRNILAFKYRSVFEAYSYVWLTIDYIMYLLFITGIILCKAK